MISAIRAVTGLLLFVVPTGGMPSVASAQTDTRQIRLLVGYAAGGLTDSLARVVAEGLRAQTGRAVVVENRPGAAGNIAALAVSKSPADGTTILFGAVALTTNSAVMSRSSPVDPVDGLTPVGLVAYTPNVLTVSPSFPARSINELVQQSKTGPGLTFASSGTGGGLHLTGEFFAVLTGAKLTHVPYRGSAPALVDLLGGRVDAQFDNVSGSLELIRENRVRALVVTSAERMKELPDVPTMAELGYDGVEVGSWFGLFYPPGASREMVAGLFRDLNALSDTPSVKKYVADVGLTPMRSESPEQFKGYLRNDAALWLRVVKSTGVKIDQ